MIIINIIIDQTKKPNYNSFAEIEIDDLTVNENAQLLKKRKIFQNLNGARTTSE